MQCSLAVFPAPPARGFVTVCETNSSLVSARASEINDLRMFAPGRGGDDDDYPRILVGTATLRASAAGETARSAFLEREETAWRRAANAWREDGLQGALQELAHDEAPASWACAVAKVALAAARLVVAAHGALFPRPALTRAGIVAEFSRTEAWDTSAARAIAWHPHVGRLAIACRDDSVRVESMTRGAVSPVLRHRAQRGVAEVAWRPLAASTLAVACRGGVVVWTLDPTSLSTRPSSGCAQTLRRAGHSPVTGVAWHPQGALLVSASAADGAMIVWDVAREEGAPLWRVGGGVGFARWSADGARLFAATPSSLFRVWETRAWTCERWTDVPGRCQAACWSPDGCTLFFATLCEPTIFYLKFRPPPDDGRPIGGGAATAVAAVDLSEVVVDDDGEKTTVGGAVRDMAWDESGERLAVMFRGEDQRFVAVFRTRVRPVVDVTPCGLVGGEPGESPRAIAFRPGFQKGALLTVCWSSGRVSFVPMFFVSSAAMAQGGRIPSPGGATNGGLRHRTALFTTE